MGELLIASLRDSIACRLRMSAARDAALFAFVSTLSILGIIGADSTFGVAIHIISPPQKSITRPRVPLFAYTGAAKVKARASPSSGLGQPRALMSSLLSSCIRPRLL